jgi:hypothetical protein
MSGWTNAVLEWEGIPRAMAGTYSVVVSNFAGMITNLRAVVDVRLPLRLVQVHWSTPGSFTYAATGNPDDPFIVESSPTLANPGTWTLIVFSRIPAGGQPVFITDPDPPASGARFYRIRPPP